MLRSESESLLEELQRVQRLLEDKNRHLAELYDAAHHFVDQVSSQFRGPLGVIREFTFILRDGLAGELNAEQREYLDIVADRVDELTLRINDMLDIRRLEGGLLSVVRGPACMDQIIREVQPLLERRASTRKVTLGLEVQGPLPDVYGDTDTIGRSVTNLTLHALSHAGQGGRVLLHARLDEEASEVLICVVAEQSKTSDGGDGRVLRLAAATDDEDAWEVDVDGEMKDAPLGLAVAVQLTHLSFGDIAACRGQRGSKIWELRLPLADPARLAARYLESLLRLKRQPSHVALIAARADLPAVSPLAGPMNDFLQRLLRSSDWVYRAGEAVWLLVVAGTGAGGELDKMIARVDQAWAEAGRHRPGGGWPGLQLEVIGTWPLSNPDQEFTQRFLDKLHHTARRSARAGRHNGDGRATPSGSPARHHEMAPYS